jgi:glutamyl-tRNA synthetase
MTVSVRFAPSPTGRLHVGSLGRALVNYLYARKHDGKFWLRLDDTDQARSKPEFVEDIEQTMAWMGLDFDHYVRESDRFERYDQVAAELRAMGRLYPAYETVDELALKRKAKLSQSLPPVYDRAALVLTEDDHRRYAAAGRKPHWRFKLEPKPVEWPDIVHGPMKFNALTMSDPVVIREDGTPLFIFTGVVDDADFGITHVIRGDDHIANTAVQIQIFEAIGAPVPVFAHLPLLTDPEGHKLSKRVGSLSVTELREQEIEAMALASLLAKLGTSDPIEPRANLLQLVDDFDLTRFNRAAVKFDMLELERLSAKVLHNLDYMEAQPRLTARGLSGLSEEFWLAVRGNLSKFSDIDTWWQVAEGPVVPVIDDPAFMAAALAELPEEPWDQTTWESWTKALKASAGKSGRELFMPLRQALTGQDHGPEMRVLLPLIGEDKVKIRLAGGTA